METGWIKLYRCSIGSRVFNNEGLLKVWIWCLLKANHSTQWVNLKTGRGSIEVECKDGQFIFGRNSAAKELDMDGSTVWKRMQKLKNMENLTIESNKQYSIISIMNWHTYQTIEKESNSQGNKQVTSKEHASNTNKNVKNVKNVKKDTYGEFENVELAIEEHDKLKKKFSNNLNTIIEKFSAYIRNKKGKPYIDHYAAILRNQDWLTPKQSNEPEYKQL